jgi:hypothetical protein
MDEITSAMSAWPLAKGVISGTQALTLGLILAATSFSMISLRRKRRERGPSPRMYAREQVARLREQKSIETDIGEIMLQLQQVAREINAQLDAKFVRLERSVRDADERIRRLERLAPTKSRAATLDVTVSDTTEPAKRAPSNSGEITRRICAMGAAGKPPADIARAVGKSIAEVQLILAVDRSSAKNAISTTA